MGTSGYTVQRLGGKAEVGQHFTERYSSGPRFGRNENGWTKNVGINENGGTRMDGGTKDDRTYQSLNVENYVHLESESEDRAPYRVQFDGDGAPLSEEILREYFGHGAQRHGTQKHLFNDGSVVEKEFKNGEEQAPRVIEHDSSMSKC
jgi:hypothetical protein